ncbi:hypothetical protein F4778DRAFT_790403 [Xylariomycetidae sp. FL2044]|nr:hypothetical protein F4778DRAFT_790403 [Xylariomycetidae sp. FL2044]
MGRWGMRLFEGDQDIDIAFGVNTALGKDDKDEHWLASLVYQSDMLCPTNVRAYYKSDEYKTILAKQVEYARLKLDSGLGDKLFNLYRSKENKGNGRYELILVGALMMRAGAKIRPTDIEYLRELVPHMNCNHKYVLPLSDEGFRGPGRIQFLTALDNYREGIPRRYDEPSCFNCGKIKDDIGHALSSCSRCKGAWYCDRDCQKKHWKLHKPNCVPPESRFMLNV